MTSFFYDVNKMLTNNTSLDDMSALISGKVTIKPPPLYSPTKWNSSRKMSLPRVSNAYEAGKLSGNGAWYHWQLR